MKLPSLLLLTALLPLATASALATPVLNGAVQLAPGENAVGPTAFAVNSATHRLYVLGGEIFTYHGRNGLKVVDTASGAVVDGIFLTDYDSGAADDDSLVPIGVAADSGSNQVFVLGHINRYGSYTMLLRFIDGATNTNVTNTGTDLKIDGLNGGFGQSAPTYVSVNSSAHKVYVADGDGNLAIVDGVTHQLLTLTHLPTNSAGVPLYDPVGNKMFFFGDSGSATVDGASDSITPLTVPFQSVVAAAFDPAGRRAYVLGRDETSSSLTLYALDADSGAVLASSTTATDSDTTALVFDQGTLYAIDGGTSFSGRSAAIDPATLTVKSTIPHQGQKVLADSGKLFLLAGYQAYTPEYRGGVGVVDETTTAYSAIITGFEPGEMAINSTTGQVFVYDTSANEVTVFDATTRAVLHHFPTLDAPASGGGYTRPIAVSSTLNRFYLLRYVLSSDPNSLAGIETTYLDVYSGVDGRIIQSIVATNNADYGYLAIDDAHGRLYASAFTNTGSANTVELLAYDVTSNALVGAFNTGAGDVEGLGINPVTQKIYLSGGHGIGEGFVTVFDASKGKTITTIQDVGSIPTSFAVNTKTNTIYVADHSGGDLDGNTVTILDGATNSVAGTFKNLSPGDHHNVAGIAVDEVTNTVYVTDQFDGFTGVSVPGAVAFFDAANNYALLGTGTLGYTPAAIQFDPVTRRLFVANLYEGTVSVLQESGGPLITPPPPVGSDIFSGAVSDLKVELDAASAKYKVKGTYTLKNVSANKLKKIAVGVYLSTSPTIALPVSSDDPALLEIPVTASPAPNAQGHAVLGVDLSQLSTAAPLTVSKIKGGETYTADFKFKVPAAALQLAASGKFQYVIVVADPKEAFSDGDTANNVVTVDLQTAVPK